MNKADLHIHSKYSSDGEYEIKDIIDKCLKNNVNIFSITDHNNVKANKEAISMSDSETIRFIPGIEIDCNYQGTDLHLLGYHIDWQSNDFEVLEKDIIKKVMDSFSEMIYNLNKLGIEVDESKVLQEAGDKLPSGELIAEVLLNDENYYNEKLLPYMPGGARSDMPYLNFYLDFFAQGKPAHVKIEYLDYSQAIELVRSNGGIPIVAHPGLNFKGKETVITELLEKGAEGVEVFNNYHNQEQMEYFAQTIIKKNALMTCGSDFHGKTKPVIDIGNYSFEQIYSDYLNNSIKKLATAY